MMLLLNFAHPVTPDQMWSILEIAGRTDITVHDIPVQIDNNKPLGPQVVTIVNQSPISSVAWQSTPILVNLPGYAPVAGTLLAELHGRMGHFPAMIRLRPILGSTATVYEVAEIINLQSVRESSRERR